MSEQPQQFTIKIRNTDDVPLEFENPIHEQYLDKIKQMKAFKDWCNGIDGDFKVKKILIQSVDMFGPRVGFIKFSADIQDKEGTKIPGVVFMRGNAVGIFVLITCEEDKKQYTVLTVQPRVPTGKYNLAELPAGMLDDSGDFIGIAAKELQEETGIMVKQKDLLDLTDMAYKGAYLGVYPSAGGCDEMIRLFLYRVKMKRSQITEIHGRCTGVLEEGEKIKLKIISIHELWRAAPDVKALSALCIYENLVARRELPADGLPPQ